MSTLKEVKYLVIHTAAASRHTTAEDVRRWHVNQGWLDIGYHYFIRPDGTLETGRDQAVVGAHTRGLNPCSLGICCGGNGDWEDFTPDQYARLYELLPTLAKEYQLSLPECVIGHREVNHLVGDVLEAKYRTEKSCPGKMVNLNTLRSRLKTITPRLPRTPDTYTNDIISDLFRYLRTYNSRLRIQDIVRQYDKTRTMWEHEDSKIELRLRKGGSESLEYESFTCELISWEKLAVHPYSLAHATIRTSWKTGNEHEFNLLAIRCEEFASTTPPDSLREWIKLALHDEKGGDAE